MLHARDCTQMAELQPRIDEAELAVADMKNERDKLRSTLLNLQQEHGACKEHALVRAAILAIEGNSPSLYGSRMLYICCDTMSNHSISCSVLCDRPVGRLFAVQR
jgi:hypothetical protein